MKSKHYIPKKLKWNSLSELKTHLEKDTNEKVIYFDGYQLVTETTRYGLYNGEISISDPIIDTIGQNQFDL